ncbi:MAG: hypothetical protein AB1772_09845 [Candidatus Zixiibacteriota bacterium]
MNRLTGVLTAVGGVILLAFGLATCDQGVKKVRIRYKHTPGTTVTFQQITRGIIQAKDRPTQRILQHEYAETTMDITEAVRRVLEDSTAEVVNTIKWQHRTRDLMDKTRSDTALEMPGERQPIVQYMKPNGRMLDMEFVSDTVKGSLEYLKEYYKQGYPVFPDGEVSQGYSWTQTTTVVLPDGPMEASTTYTIKSFARERGYDCAVIEYDGLCIIPLPAKQMEKIDVISGVDRITSKGHMYFAYKEGMLVQLKERWILSSDRLVIEKEPKPECGYEPGDTARIEVGIEYDVDFYLTGSKAP